MPNSTPFKLWGFPYKIGELKLKFLPTEREEKNCSTSLLQHSTLIDIWNICAAELCLFDSNSSSSLVMEILDICNGHWRIIWTHIHVYSLVIIMSMAEFLQRVTVTDLCPELSHCCSRVPDIWQCSRTQTLFQNSDTVPDSLMADNGPRYLAYYCYYYYYSALCRKALLAIVYCTRSTKFFLLYWCNTNWHFLASYNNFYS